MECTEGWSFCCSTKQGDLSACMKQHTLPKKFIKGLTTTSLQGRAQIVPDQFINDEIPNELVFFLDGAHSPESMEACTKWFSLAIKDEDQILFHQKPDNSNFSSSEDAQL
ncbi:hypothetical protein JHK82_052478 [Glycine max]|uniref:Folylpolyglutamate synthase n=1 Tax=Glycine soja TaxID=3848 RepID=A0A0B2R3W1_GLYSO|nr:hypothetical protein JHK86_052322 [Glycine max]KAG4926691.1 hypothetical protein JHK85_053177 [Glycine max]KAG5082325.1 hypothetical protein JHK84_052363 [Glycine max]KAG5085081.1 hypothetical protein JHK82_052478 [Glycine max]KHN28345.1 Folylpolyglutamate synthase [Glycine soja]